jgi:hypothetical protein
VALLAAAVILLSTGAVTPDEETTLLAASVGVDPVELQGAANTTGSSPIAYLAHEGLLDPPVTHAVGKTLPPSVVDSPPAPTSGVWPLLAQCESNGRWDRNSGNGYFGGLQEDMTFWRNYGGLAYAPRPDLASPAAQMAVAERGRARQGFGAWPACSRRLGLR